MCIRPLKYLNKIEINTTLKRLGFTENSYVETIVVTENPNGFYNAAPMGIIKFKNGLEVRPYKSSKTYMNLLKSNHASINITDDPLLFLQTAFKDELDEQPNIQNWRVDGVDAVIMIEKKRKNKFSELRSSFVFNPISISIYRDIPTVFSRSRANAIEAIIHTTRVKVVQSESRLFELESLIKKIEECLEVIKRVSSEESGEMKVARVIKKLLENWGAAVT
jgi:hypothetical protein